MLLVLLVNGRKERLIVEVNRLVGRKGMQGGFGREKPGLWLGLP